MSKRKQRSKSQYSQHTINVADEHWNFIEAESRKRRISKSKFIASLIQWQQEGGYVKTSRHLGEWLTVDRLDIDLITHRWVYQTFPDQLYFSGTGFGKRLAILDPYVDEGKLQNYFSEAEKFYEILSVKLKSEEALTFYEIYDKGAIEEFTDPNGRFSDIEAGERIQLLENMQCWLREYPRKFNIRLTDVPITLPFQIQGGLGWYRAYIQGSCIHLDTDSRTIIEGLFCEFDHYWNKCTMSGIDVVDFLEELIEKIKGSGA